MQMPPVRQAELHSDLKIQEKDELQWKKLKAEGMDENGEREAKLRRNFNGRFITWLTVYSHDDTILLSTKSTDMQSSL